VYGGDSAIREQFRVNGGKTRAGVFKTGKPVEYHYPPIPLPDIESNTSDISSRVGPSSSTPDISISKFLVGSRFRTNCFVFDRRMSDNTSIMTDEYPNPVLPLLQPSVESQTYSPPHVGTTAFDKEVEKYLNLFSEIGGSNTSSQCECGMCYARPIGEPMQPSGTTTLTRKA